MVSLIFDTNSSILLLYRHTLSNVSCKCKWNSFKESTWFDVFDKIYGIMSATICAVKQMVSRPGLAGNLDRELGIFSSSVSALMFSAKMVFGWGDEKFSS